MPSDKELLAEIASMYYEQDLIQSEIARQVGLSRPKVSRLLKEARDLGVVKILIDYPWNTDAELEAQLLSRYSLKAVRVLVSKDRPYEQMLQGLGALAARYVETILKPDDILGMSWGTALYQTARAMHPEQKKDIKVVQMIGAVGTSDPLIDGPDLARFLADLYGGEYRYLHAPLVVKDPAVRDALLQEDHVRETLELARTANIALVGIGTMIPESSSLVRAGYLDAETASRMEQSGVVGGICARQYDINGQILDSDLNRRIIGIELEALHHINQVIGVAGGEAKAKTILGALRGNHVNVLITDDRAARKVLAMDSVN